MLRPQYPFYMIRHGETDWNREGRFQGQTDIPLNFKGRQQAAYNGRKLKSILANPSEWRFVASPMGRTRNTMEIARLQMELEPKEYETDDRLIEITFGRWEKSTIKELAAKNQFDIERRELNKWNFTPPDGESYASGAIRAEPFFAELNSPTVIVTHGGIIRAVRHLIEGLNGNEAAVMPTPQDRIYHFDGETGGWLD